MQSNCPPAALSRTGAVLVWVVGAVAGALRICEQPGTAAQAQLAVFPASGTLSFQVFAPVALFPIVADELVQSGPV
jgi:hypothetical protein